MKRTKEINRLAALIAKALSLSQYYAEHSAHVIINPASGTISRPHKLAKLIQSAEETFAAQLSQKNTRPVAFHISPDPEGPERIAAMIVQSTEGKKLIISCGGDGTHNMVINGILKADKEKIEDTTLMRLPLGSGNDAADAPELIAALKKLAESKEKTAIPLYVMSTAKDNTKRYGCNIISFGIDAYISLVTNRIKPYLPGDTYKLIADLSTLFYQMIHPQAELTIRTEKDSYTAEYLLTAIGASGARTYGNGKKILPDSNNVCAVKNCSLRERLLLKKRIYKGEHIKQEKVLSLSAERLTIEYSRPLPVQEDGEAWWLAEDDFPVNISIVKDAIKTPR